MLLSVIIPVYNVKDYLEKCVASVMDENVSDYEIVLVDDGSTDGESGALCDAIAEKHPELIRVIHQENMGLGGARNTGIKESKGEYLFFVDSDDTVVSGTLSVITKKIEETQPDILAFNLYTDDGEGHREPVDSNYVQRSEAFTLEECPEYLFSLPNAWSRVWKKTLYTDNCIYYPHRAWYEDIRTTSKLFAVAESIVTIENRLYLYLQRSGSIMHSAKLERNREIIDAFEDLLEWYKKHGLFEKYKDILCRLCIDHVYLAASVRVLRADAKHPLLGDFSEYVKKEFPDYKKNPYISGLSGAKRLVFRLLEMKQYKLLSLLFRLRGE